MVLDNSNTDQIAKVKDATPFPFWGPGNFNARGITYGEAWRTINNPLFKYLAEGSCLENKSEERCLKKQEAQALLQGDMSACCHPSDVSDCGPCQALTLETRLERSIGSASPTLTMRSYLWVYLLLLLNERNLERYYEILALENLLMSENACLMRLVKAKPETQGQHKIMKILVQWVKIHNAVVAFWNKSHPDTVDGTQSCLIDILLPVQSEISELSEELVDLYLGTLPVRSGSIEYNALMKYLDSKSIPTLCGVADSKLVNAVQFEHEVVSFQGKYRPSAKKRRARARRRSYTSNTKR